MAGQREVIRTEELLRTVPRPIRAVLESYRRDNLDLTRISAETEHALRRAIQTGTPQKVKEVLSKALE